MEPLEVMQSAQGSQNVWMSCQQRCAVPVHSVRLDQCTADLISFEPTTLLFGVANEMKEAHAGEFGSAAGIPVAQAVV